MKNKYIYTHNDFLMARISTNQEYEDSIIRCEWMEALECWGECLLLTAAIRNYEGRIMRLLEDILQR